LTNPIAVPEGHQIVAEILKSRPSAVATVLRPSGAENKRNIRKSLMSSELKHRFTPEEYLAFERMSELRHE
jgi:hypothetical protein